MYFIEFRLLSKNQGLQYYGLVKNSHIINNLNYMHTYCLNLGNCFLEKSYYKYSVGLNGYSFLKFKKPFNYRSKKKKK